MTLRLTGALLCGAALLIATQTGAYASADKTKKRVLSNEDATISEGGGGIGVGVESSPGGIIIATTTTNGTGEFSIASVRPGTYKIRITSGPDKGKVLQTTTITKAGPVSGKIVPKAK